MNLEKSKLLSKEYILIILVNFLAAMNFYLLMIIVSEYAMNKFDSSTSQAGLAASIFIIGALIARLFAGKWITRTGYKKMLYIGVIASIVMTLAYFGVNSITLLFIVRFMHGMAFGITSTSTATIVADIVPKERSGEGIGYYSLSQTLATAIGPFLGMFFSRYGSYNTIFTTCAIASAISLVMTPFLSLRKIELTGEQVKEMREFKISNFVEPRAISISIISLLIYLCYYGWAFLSDNCEYFYENRKFYMNALQVSGQNSFLRKKIQSFLRYSFLMLLSLPLKDGLKKLPVIHLMILSIY